MPSGIPDLLTFRRLLTVWLSAFIELGWQHFFSIFRQNKTYQLQAPIAG